jgi:hypothetical protein
LPVASTAWSSAADVSRLRIALSAATMPSASGSALARSITVLAGVVTGNPYRRIMSCGANGVV